MYRRSPSDPVDPSFRALSGRLQLTVRRHKSSKDSLCTGCPVQGPGSRFCRASNCAPGGVGDAMPHWSTPNFRCSQNYLDLILASGVCLFWFVWTEDCLELFYWFFGSWFMVYGLWLTGRLKFTVHRHRFSKDVLFHGLWFSVECSGLKGYRLSVQG